MKSLRNQLFFEGLRPKLPITIGMNDDSLMPFGKYKGKALESIPASYFHWLWFEAGVKNQRNHVLHDYISENINAFKDENKDLIWS